MDCRYQEAPIAAIDQPNRELRGPARRTNLLELAEWSLDSGEVCVSARGELDLSSADELKALLLRELSSAKRLVLDLSALDFMDSTGLAVIVQAINSARRSSGALELYAQLRSQPQRLMELTGVLQSLTLIDALPPAHDIELLDPLGGADPVW